jgi:hypothetical protein
MKWCLAILMTLLSTSANALTSGTVSLIGVVASTCAVTAFTSGTMTADQSATTLSTTTPASFTAVVTGTGFRVTFGTPTLTGPSGVVNATITLTPTSTGLSILNTAINGITVAGTTVTMPAAGTYTYLVSGTATLSTGSFAAGTYNLSAVATCGP